MCTGANSLLGTISPHPLSYMMLSTCMLLTMTTRIAGLVMAIMYQYKIISIIYPPQDITDEMSEDGCDWLSVLGEEGLEVYRKNSMVYHQVHGEGKLMYSNKGWKVWETTGDLISMDTFHMQEGNTTYGYYCKDISTIFSYHWLSLLSWIILFILPPLLLSFCLLLFTFRSNCCFIIYSYPMCFLSAIFSYITIGPTHCSFKTPTYFALSVHASCINLLLTMAAVITMLSFISSSINPLPIIILGSLFFSSSFITIIFLLIFSSSSSSSCTCFCPKDKKSARLVWETVDPSKTAVKLKMFV